jgi:hypothetical protein
LQQPCAQEAASQTQAPALLHSWPVAQVTHALPPTPQLFADDVWQVPLESQQPFAQVVALQAPQVWLVGSHSCPMGQSPFPVQPQTPLRQRWPSALLVQSTQAPPVVPQAAGALPAAQLVPEQQPPLQVPLPLAPHRPVQAPLEQVGVKPVHSPHAAPPVPHEELVWPA